MEELHFCLKGKLGEIERQQQKISTLANKFGCEIQAKDVSTEGKKFKIIGSQANLLKLQAALKDNNLPTGLLNQESGKVAICQIKPIKKRL